MRNLWSLTLVLQTIAFCEKMNQDIEDVNGVLEPKPVLVGLSGKEPKHLHKSVKDDFNASVSSSWSKATMFAIYVIFEPDVCYSWIFCSMPLILLSCKSRGRVFSKKGRMM